MQTRHGLLPFHDSERPALLSSSARAMERAGVQRSEITGDLRRLEPVVVPAVHVPDRQPGELLGRDVVEAGHADRHEGAADLLDVAVAERRDAAVLQKR